MRIFFFFNDTATTEIYTLSLHDALPISPGVLPLVAVGIIWAWIYNPNFGFLNEILKLIGLGWLARGWLSEDRKSTRLNSSHANISYAVFCLKKKNRIYTLTLFSWHYSIP